MDHQLISATILFLGAVLILPTKIWLLSPFVAASAYMALRLANHAKEQAVGLPITWLDCVLLAKQPAVVARALGFHGSILILASVTVISLAILVAFGVKKAGGRALAQRIAAATLLSVVGIAALLSSVRDLQRDLAQRYPDIAQILWEPYGQRVLVSRIGPLEYLAFTYVVGASDWLTAEGNQKESIPSARIEQAAAKFVGGRSPQPLPNIVIFHAESSFDPNLIFRLNSAVPSPLWTARPGTALLGPLRVNIVGGGTQVTQFELFTGLDTRQFGYWGFYAPLTIGPHVRNAFPSYLARKGYRTIASYPVGPEWMGAAAAFRAYGFGKTFYGPELHLKGDWSENDQELVGRFLAKGVLEPQARPVFVYVSTLENHGPHPCEHFQSRSEFITRFQGQATFAQDCSINEYVRRAHSTALAMQGVLSRLRALEEKTKRPFVLLIYGDHQPFDFTDGDYSIAGGIANAGDTGSFAHYRRGANQNITFYHVITSVKGRRSGPYTGPLPVTLLPTLLSTFVASNASDTYLPLNFMMFEQCGSDYRACRYPEWQAMESQARAQILGSEPESSSDLHR